MARSLDPDDYEHSIICQEAWGALPNLLREEGWSIHEIGLAPHILSPRWHSKAAKIALQYRPDIIHGAVFEGVALAAGIGLRLPKIPVVSEETSDPINRSWRGTLLMRAMCMRSQVVIGVSPRAGAYLRDTAKVPAHKVRVINNAVLPAPAQSESDVHAIREKYGFTSADFVVGTVGRIYDEHKRFSDLIRATSALIGSNFQVKLMIVGDGPDLADLQTLAKDLGVQNAVIFTGYQGDVRELYPAMDVFALASVHEAFGLVLVEAMLAQVPVIATRVGGIPFVLDDGNAGRLVPPRCVDAFVQAIGELISNDSLRNSLALAGRERAEREFSGERYSAEINQLYRGLVKWH